MSFAHEDIYLDSYSPPLIRTAVRGQLTVVRAPEENLTYRVFDTSRKSIVCKELVKAILDHSLASARIRSRVSEYGVMALILPSRNSTYSFKKYNSGSVVWSELISWERTMGVPTLSCFRFTGLYERNYWHAYAFALVECLRVLIFRKEYASSSIIVPDARRTLTPNPVGSFHKRMLKLPTVMGQDAFRMFKERRDHPGGRLGS